MVTLLLIIIIIIMKFFVFAGMELSKGRADDH